MIGIQVLSHNNNKSMTLWPSKIQKDSLLKWGFWYILIYIDSIFKGNQGEAGPWTEEDSLLRASPPARVPPSCWSPVFFASAQKKGQRSTNLEEQIQSQILQIVVFDFTIISSFCCWGERRSPSWLSLEVGTPQRTPDMSKWFHWSTSAAFSEKS